MADRTDKDGPATPPLKSGKGGQGSGVSSTRIYLLLGIFFAGFMALVTLHQVTGYLIDELNRQTANERARLSIGEIIINDLVRIESGVYKMATIRGVRGQQRVRKDTLRGLDQLRDALRVLDQGGTLKRATHLNIESQERMIRSVEYHPNERESQYVLEVIDLSPKLLQVERKITRLAELLIQREQLRDSEERDAYVASIAEIKGFLRTLPPLFTRMNENANRLFFESRRRLDTLEEGIEERHRDYTLAELVLTIAIVVAVLSLGFVILAQVAASNRRLRETGEEMAAARRAAEQANLAKSSFLANMSHELRTPMNAVLGYAQLLQVDEKLSPTHREEVEQILQSGQHLLDLINEVLDLSKVEAGRLELEQIEFPLIELVEEVARTYGPQARAKGLELIVAPAPTLPAIASGDPTRLRQVLINLLGNAIKFTERGEVELSARPLDPEREDRRGEILFEVRDTGIGIPPENRERLFRPFTQGDESMTRRFGGTGLGLVLTKQLAEAMGGRLELESEAGRGSRFRVRIPLAAEAVACPPLAALEGKRILVVDGNATARAALGGLLRAWGAVRADAAEGAAALALMRAAAASAPYDWLIIDHHLHDMEGIELARRVSADTQYPTPRMILLTADAPPDERALLTAGVESHLSKPLVSGQLHDALLNPPPTPTTPSTAARPTPGGAPADDQLSGHILLVEDNFINRQVATGMLLQFGLKVESAEDGEEALQRLDESHFDLVLMDVQMPRMDGYEATRRLRERERERGAEPMAVIAMTANAMVGDREKCLEAGMDDHLPKPVEMEMLRERLGYWLGKDRG